MSRKRVLLVGYGRIGREVFIDYCEAFAEWEIELLVTDFQAEVPVGYEWDGGRVDLAVVMVDTPAADRHLSGGFDYHQLLMALGQSLDVAEYVLVRSTVGLDFLEAETYRWDADRIGFSPEFHGATRHSRRGELELDFVAFSDTVPLWFVRAVCSNGRQALIAPAGEVIVAKLTENAFLAMKVTFFHELAVTCRVLGLSFDAVREIVTADPRIAPGHSRCDDGLGWSSHCFNKDVPVFAALGGGSRLLNAVMGINDDLLASNEAGSLRPV